MWKYPLYAVIAFLFGGAMGRLRGAGLVPDWVARFILWGLPVGIVILFATGNLIYSLAAIGLSGAGASMGYWGTFDLATIANRTFSNYAKLTATACYRFFPLLLAAACVGWGWNVLPGVIAGLAFVPAYLLGCKMSGVKLPLLQIFSEWGEFFFWGTLFSALVMGMIV